MQIGCTNCTVRFRNRERERAMVPSRDLLSLRCESKVRNFSVCDDLRTKLYNLYFGNVCSSLVYEQRSTVRLLRTLFIFLIELSHQRYQSYKCVAETLCWINCSNIYFPFYFHFHFFVCKMLRRKNGMFPIIFGWWY